MEPGQTDESRFLGYMEGFDRRGNELSSVGGMRSYSGMDSVIFEDIGNKALDGRYWHKNRAAGMSSLPFHPVAPISGDDGFPFASHRRATVPIG